MKAFGRKSTNSNLNSTSNIRTKNNSSVQSILTVSTVLLGIFGTAGASPVLPASVSPLPFTGSPSLDISVLGNSPITPMAMMSSSSTPSATSASTTSSSSADRYPELIAFSHSGFPVALEAPLLYPIGLLQSVEEKEAADAPKHKSKMPKVRVPTAFYHKQMRKAYAEAMNRYRSKASSDDVITLEAQNSSSSSTATKPIRSK